MKKIHLTKTDWNITAVYSFREDGVCISVQLPDDIPADKVRGFYSVAGIGLSKLVMLQMEDRTIKIEEQLDLSFDYAWQKYNYKQGKLKAKEAWEKLSESNKIKALNGMEPYARQLYGTTTAKLYFERYCKYKKWEDFL